MSNSESSGGLGRRQFIGTSLSGISGAALLAGCTGEPEPPRFEITTDRRFDVSSIPAYAGDHSAAYAYIDRNLDPHLEQLRRWLRQPSESTSGRGIPEMAELLRTDLQALDFQEAELVPTSRHPGVWGYHDAGASSSIPH